MLLGHPPDLVLWGFALALLGVAVAAPGGAWATSLDVGGWGEHTLHVRVVEGAGNVAEAQVSFRTEEKVEPVSESNLVWPLMIVIIVLVFVVALLLFRSMRPGRPGGGT